MSVTIAGISAVIALVISISSLMVSLNSTRAQLDYAQRLRLANNVNIAVATARFVKAIAGSNDPEDADRILETDFETLDQACRSIDYSQIYPAEMVIKFMEIRHMLARSHRLWEKKISLDTYRQDTGFRSDSAMSAIRSYAESRGITFDSDGIARSPKTLSTWQMLMFLPTSGS